MRTAIVLGTRPEIIKMSPVIREFKRRGVDFFVLHTGQHYSFELDGAFFRDLELEEPEVNLGVGSGSHAVQTGRILVGVEDCIRDGCGLVLVEGDTNSVLGGALAAAKLNITVGHVEAGLRSFDRSMPEEINRILADHVSTYLFAPTEVSRSNLLREGLEDSKIFVTGNTVVDALWQNLEIAERKRTPLRDLGLDVGEYFLVTCHRAENTDNSVRLRSILGAFKRLSEKYGVPVVYPIHPRASKMIESFGLDTERITTLPPIGYLDFLLLEKNARLILTDSGGVQEEACILKTPCVTLRDNTERPETVEVGANIIAGAEVGSVVDCVELMLGKEKDWPNPFGEGDAAVKIADITHIK